MENQLEQNPDILREITDTCQNERLAVILDIGHAHCISGLPVLDWIKLLNCKIQYVHLHQNNGVVDEHLGLKRGNIQIKEILNGLNEFAPEAVWALECNLDDMEDSIFLLGEYGFI